MYSKLVILYGGPSSERDVSFGTKDFFHDLYKELNPKLIEWKEDFTFKYDIYTFSENQFLRYLIDTEHIVLLASHGEYIEDGYIQNSFEKNNIRFTGSDSKACSLTMDKVAAQKAVSDIVRTIPTHTNYKKLKFPFIAKPNNLGSSVGIYLINSEKGLNKYMPYFTDNYIYQPFIKGRELSLAFVKGIEDLYPTEIIPNAAFFDYDSKYTIGSSKEVTPAKIDHGTLKQIRDVTKRIHNKLGLGFYSRSDFILTDNNDLYYLETNALPGMTKTSLVPQQLEHSNKIDQFKEGLLRHLC